MQSGHKTNIVPSASHVTTSGGHNYRILAFEFWYDIWYAYVSCIVAEVTIPQTFFPIYMRLHFRIISNQVALKYCGWVTAWRPRNSSTLRQLMVWRLLLKPMPIYCQSGPYEILSVIFESNVLEKFCKLAALSLGLDFVNIPASRRLWPHRPVWNHFHA